METETQVAQSPFTTLSDEQKILNLEAQITALRQQSQSLNEFIATQYTEVLSNMPDTSNDVVTMVHGIRSYLEKLIDDLPGCVVWLDKEATIRGINANYMTFLGEGLPDDLRYMDLRRIKITSDRLQNLLDDYNDVIRSGEPKVYEVLINRQVYRSSWVPLTNQQGHIVGVLNSMLDLTEHRYNVSEEQDGPEAINQHNQPLHMYIQEHVQTPLEQVKQLTQFLSQRHEYGDSTAYNDIIQSAARMKEYVSYFLRYTYHTKRLSVEFKPEDVVRSVYEIQRPAVLDKGLEFHFVFDKSIPRMVVGNVAIFKSVLLSLINNALHHTSGKSLTLRVDAAPSWYSKYPAVLCCEVEATGLRISKKTKQALFHREVAQEDQAFSASCLGPDLHRIKLMLQQFGDNLEVSEDDDGDSQLRVWLPFSTSTEQ